MRALRLHAIHDLRLHEEAEIIPRLGEELIRVKAVGICGSDLQWWSHGGIGDSRLAHPLVLGHEFSGETSAGQRIAVDPCISCGACEQCLAGNPNLCESILFAGHGQQDGALRQFIAWPTRCCFPIPDSLSDDDGAMLEPLGVAIHSIDLAHLKPGMRVGVLGCGPIGLLIIQLARHAGTTVDLSTDALSHRTDAAKKFGAAKAITVDVDSVNPDSVRDAGVPGLDVIFEVAGQNAAVETAIELLKPGGKIILVGIPKDDRTSYTASIARRKGITFKQVRRMKYTYPRAIDLVTSGSVDVRSLVTGRYPLTEASKAFQTAEHREGLKVVIEMNS
jgi:L-iditol 2-dehydrogenase